MTYSKHHQEWLAAVCPSACCCCSCCWGASHAHQKLASEPTEALIFLPLSFWGTRLPFWFSLSAAGGSVTDTAVAGRGPAYVLCVCVCYVWILRKAAWYFIFKLWLLLHSPTYNGSTPEGWDSLLLSVFKGKQSHPSQCHQENRIKVLAWRFSFSQNQKNKKTQEITKNIKPSLSSQLHAAVFLQAVEYCASPSNCCGFRDFSRFLFLEICWSSASFPQLRARPLHGSVLTGFTMTKTTGFIMKWRVETGVSPHLKAEPAMDLPGLKSWRRQNPGMLIKAWCYGSPFLESLTFRCAAKLTN